jgi:hypothetical protein
MPTGRDDASDNLAALLADAAPDIPEDPRVKIRSIRVVQLPSEAPDDPHWWAFTTTSNFGQGCQVQIDAPVESAQLSEIIQELMTGMVTDPTTGEQRWPGCPVHDDHLVPRVEGRTGFWQCVSDPDIRFAFGTARQAGQDPGSSVLS